MDTASTSVSHSSNTKLVDLIVRSFIFTVTKSLLVRSLSKSKFSQMSLSVLM